MKNGTVSVFGEAIERAVKERAHLIKLLQDSQKEYLSYVENVSEAQWNWKPGQDRWSVGETAEHILLARGSFV
jgi:broad-specificity NMP kinase